MWLLYVNDITKNIESEILLFADDTCCFATGKDPAETAVILNRDLERLNVWATKWKVIFNPGKSKDLIFSERKVLFNSPPLVLNGAFVERVHEHKHLGVYLSSSLCWARQVHETCLRANRKLAVLRSVKFLKRSTLDLLYKVCVRSTVEYGLVLYWHSLKQTEAARIRQIQYRGARIVTGALPFTSQSKLESDLALETVDNRAKFLGLTIFHKIHLGLTRPLIRNCMPQRNTNNTRAAGCYVLPKFTSVSYKNSFFPFYSNLWSNLCQSIRNEPDVLLFKDKLKIFYKPKKQKHFSYGEKRANTLLCRLRVGRSFLRSHGFQINLSNTDRCWCGEEDQTQNFLLSCFLFQEEQKEMLEKVQTLLPNFLKQTKKRQCSILLFGINLDSTFPDPRNKILTLIVQKYISKTNRFSKHYD